MLRAKHVGELEVEQDCLFPLVTGTRVAEPDPGGELIIGQGSAPWPWWRTFNRGQGGGLITGPGCLHADPG